MLVDGAHDSAMRIHESVRSSRAFEKVYFKDEIEFRKGICYVGVCKGLLKVESDIMVLGECVKCFLFQK